MTDAVRRWMPLTPSLAPQLVDARLQLHHAAQFGSALGISYLPKRADDSHTNLEWLPVLCALASNPVHASTGAIRVAVRVPDLTLLILGDGDVAALQPMIGRTIEQVAVWIRAQLDQRGVPGADYTLARHFEIPRHAVAAGAPFSANLEHLEELARWFGNAEILISELTTRVRGAGSVRCWPHHFDIAALISLGGDRSVGVGLEPGDSDYAQPYFYANGSPAPRREKVRAPLAGGGSWHTREWIGAVLRGESLDSDARKQESQVRDFLSGASAEMQRLVLG